MKAGEVYGFRKKEIEFLLNKSGYEIKKIVPFLFGLNRLYIASKSRTLKK